MPGTPTPEKDRHPGLLRLYVCKPRGREAAGSSIGEILTSRYATLRIASAVDSPTWCGSSFQGAWRVDVMLSLAFSLRSAKQRLFDKGSVRSQHFTVVATLGPQCLLYTVRVWMRGATGPRRCRSFVFVSPDVLQD